MGRFADKKKLLNWFLRTEVFQLGAEKAMKKKNNCDDLLQTNTGTATCKL